MKQIVLLISISILVSTNLISQSWDFQTIWIYETDEYGPPISGNYIVHSISSDTMIEEEHYFKVQTQYRNPYTGDLRLDAWMFFLQYENQQVFIYDWRDSTKHMIYDFSLEAGQSYLAYCDWDGEYFAVHIDSVGEFIQNGVQRKIQYVSSEYTTSCHFQGIIVEGMGAVEHILPRYGTVDPPPGGIIRCFNDVSISYPVERHCLDLITSVESVPTEPLRFYPNPVLDIIYLEGEFDKTYRIFNATGNLVEEGTMDYNMIRTDNLPMGIYYLSISQVSKPSMHKFVKE